jgi:hypothetical protein
MMARLPIVLASAISTLLQALPAHGATNFTSTTNYTSSTNYTTVTNYTVGTKINSQVRLAYAGDTGMYVSWNTFEKISNPTVHFGLSPDGLSERASSSNISVTYPTSLTYNNHVKLTGLQPNTQYYYLPGDLLNTTDTSIPFSFKTSRPIGDGSSYTIAMFADLGTMGPLGLTTKVGKGGATKLAPGENNTIESLQSQSNQFDFMWHGMNNVTPAQFIN